MSKVRVLNQTDILEVLRLPDVMEAAERAYVQKSTGVAEL